MRRMKNDEGAVAVLVAILAVVMFGFATLVIDVGALYHERRQLQNGADAAALAVARDCAGGSCGPYNARAESYADANAADGAARIPLTSAGDAEDGVCGSASAGLTECADPPSIAGSGYVRVTARTALPGGSKLLPPIFARVIDPSYNGKDVQAEATVVWGAPGGLASAIPVTLSQCEFNKFVTASGGLVPPPDYAANPTYGYSSTWLTTTGRTKERVFYTHDSTGASVDTETSCPATPPGGDASGSFGWLAGTDSICAATTVLSPDGTPGYESSQGNSAPVECKQGDFPKAGTVVYLPIYDYFTVKTDTSSPSNAKKTFYHVDQYVAFYITGYNLQLPNGGGPGGGTGDEKRITASPPDNACTGQLRCISGFFTSGSAPSGGPVMGPSAGVSITQLIR